MPTCTLPYGPAAVAGAAALIGRGGCVAVPTETVYGLAADATDSRAVAGIYAAKGRPSFNPLIVHVADAAAARAIATFDARAEALAERWWPGPLTMVLPMARASGVADLVTAGLSTVAVRVPAHRAMQALLAASGRPLAAPSALSRVAVRVPAHRAMQALLAASGRPLAAPSANASGAISPTTAAHVAASLGGRIPLILDDGPTPSGIESTIVDPAARLVLRPGPIGAEDLGFARADTAAGTITAPGQLASHYAPRKPLRLNVVSPAPDEWMIGFDTVDGDDTLSASGDLIEAASRLFTALHRADASSRPGIAIAPIPDAGIGAAIADRLARAAVR